MHSAIAGGRIRHSLILHVNEEIRYSSLLPLFSSIIGKVLWIHYTVQFSAVVFFGGENIQMCPGDSQHWRLEVKWIDIGAHQVQLIWFVKCVSYIQRLPDNLDNFSRVKAVKRENTKDKYLYNFHKNFQPAGSWTGIDWRL